MENKKTWITVLIVVIIVIALVAAIWAGNKGETTEEEQIQEDQVTETQTNPEQEDGVLHFHSVHEKRRASQ